MANIVNYNETWDGHTGSEVQSFVNGKLESHETSIDSLNSNAITNITFALDETVKSKINYTYTKGGVTIPGSFSTTVQSNYNATLELDDTSTPTAIAYGEDLVIYYRYSVYDTSIGRYGGFSGNLKYTINGVTHDNIIIDRTYTTSNARRYTLTIPASLMRSGMNNINIEVYSEPTADSQTNIATISLNVYALKLSLDLTTESINNFTVSDTDEFTLNLSVTNNGSTIQNLSADSIHYCMFVDGTLFVTNTLDVNYTASLSDLTLENIKTTSSLTSYGDTVGMYFYAYATVNSKTIYSNYIYILLIRYDQVSLNNHIAVGYRFNDVSSIGNNGIVTLNRTQYGSDSFTYYVYANNPAEYSLKKYNSSTSTQTTITEADTSHVDNTESIDVIPLNVQYDSFGNYNYNLYVEYKSTSELNPSPKVAIQINIAELATSLKMPTGAAVNLQAKNKQAGNNDNTWNLNEGSNVSCIFNNFNWTGNGWVSTTDGNALLINDGATLTIPYSVCNQTLPPYAFSISFKYKVLNGIDENEVLMSCMSNNTGFNIYPNLILFGVGNVRRLNIDMTNTHEVTLVYYGDSDNIYANMAAIYIDGKYLAIFSTGSIMRHDSFISITSSIADVYLYSVIAYPKALSFTLVLALYCFNNKSTADISAYINANNVFGTMSTSEIASYGLRIKPENLPNGSAYMVLECDSEDRAWEIINSYTKTEENKKRKHYLRSAALYVKGADGTDALNRNFYAAPAVISGQGTSSMDYPLKNYRVYFNKKADIAGYTDAGKTSVFYERVKEGETESAYLLDSVKGYRMFDPIYGDSDYARPSAYSLRLCLKADYAESSSSHNTGFARLTNEVLSKSAILQDNTIAPAETGDLPQQLALKLAEAAGTLDYNYDIRANIDGRPIYLFFKVAETANNVTSDVYYFAGRYNMNNDKSNEDVFGFLEKGQGITLDYYKNEIVRAEGTYLKRAYVDIDPYYAETHGASDNDEFINPTECWEFSANEHTGSDVNGIMGAFQYPFSTAFTVKNDENKLIWLNESWEYRYPDVSDKAGDEHYQSGESKPVLLYKLYEWLYSHNYTRTNQILDLQTFASELHLYFNVNYLLKYYVLTHWFGSVDLRIKNSMLSFYCDPYGVSSQEATLSPLHYMRGYFIFYDNDTILGIDNNGDQNKINWNVDEPDGVFPGSPNHAIWSNLYICHQAYLNNTQGSGSSIYKLGKLVNDAFLAVRTYISSSVFAKYFDLHITYFPDSILNVDAEIKYIYPTLLNPSQLEPFGLSKALGTREYYRDYWFNNRTNWLDDRYKAGNYNKYIISIKPSATGNASNVSGTITVKPTTYFRDWRFYLSGDTANSLTALLTNGNSGTLTFSNQSVSSSINIFGLYACEEIDFSECNWGNGVALILVSEYNFPFLKKLKFGKDEPGATITFPSEQLNTLLTNRLYPALQELTLTNIEAENNGSYSLDFSNFLKLTKLSLNGVSINNITLPDSNTLTTLIMNCPPSLTLKNKTNITLLDLSNISTLTTVVLDNDNALVNKTILTLAANGNTISSITIKYGANGSNYTIDLTEINYLVTLASKEITKNVSGSIFAPDIDTTLLSILKAAYPSLNVETSLSGDITLVVNKTQLYEGETLSVMTTNGVLGDVSDWLLFVDNNQAPTTSEYFTLTATNTGSCTVKAVEKEDNTSHEFVIWIGFEKSDGTYQLSDPVYVHYVEMSSIILTSSADYVLLDALYTVSIGFNANCTKKFLFNEDNQSNITFSVSNSASYTIVKDNGLITGLSVLKTSEPIDTILVSCIGQSSNVLQIELDEPIAVINTISDQSSSLYWLYLYLYNIYGNNIASTYYKLDLQGLVFDWTSFNTVLSRSGNSDTMAVLDLSMLKYFRWNGTAFSVGGNSNVDFNFGNLTVPNGMTTFVWSTNLTYFNKGKITLPSSIKKCLVRLTVSNGSFPSGLQFDISLNENIKNIYNADTQAISSVQEGTFSIYMRDDNDNPNTGSYDTNKPLFIYHPSLVYDLIGNMDLALSSSATLPAMFDISRSDARFDKTAGVNLIAYKPFYHLGSPLVDNVGYFTTYFVTGSDYPITLNNSVKKIYRTYFRLPVATAINFELNNTGLLEIGDMSFYLTATDTKGTGNVTLSNNIIKIGSYAFYNFEANIFNGNNGLDLTKITNIGECAFARCSSLTSILLSFETHELSIGARAFEAIGGKNYSSSVTIRGTDINNLTIDASAFDVPVGNNAPTIYVSNATIQSALQLINNSWNVQLIS